MNIKAIRSDVIYKEMVNSFKEQKEDIYRYRLMKPFEYKWKCIGVPLKSEELKGYDVVSYSTVSGGYHPLQITNERINEINKISDEEFWNKCEESIRKTLEGFEANGISLPTQNYIFTILLSNPENPMAKMTGDYCGDGGIPGYIIGTIVPNDISLNMLPVALAHEANHNVRWQFIPWSPNITLADMIISEGIAISFEAYLFGEDKIGRWGKGTSIDVLNNIIKPAIKDNLYEKDFSKISAYLYGDEITEMNGGKIVGVPYCSGYVCGYELIKYYLNKTGKNIFDATITPTDSILNETEEFWK